MKRIALKKITLAALALLFSVFAGCGEFLPVVVDPGTESDPWDRETVTDMKYIDWERGYLTTTDQVQ